METIRRGLERHVLGRTIVGVKSYGERVVRRAPQGLEPLKNSRISAVVRRGKFLWFDLGDAALVAHLGMSGQFRLGGCVRHTRAVLTLDDGQRRIFADQRTFGYLAPDFWAPSAVPGGEGSQRCAIPSMVQHIARDLLDPALDRQRLSERTCRKKTPIKTALLDQTLVSGIGSIYADEALFAARIHPLRPANTLTGQSVFHLYTEASAVLEAALMVGGTSFDALYVGVDGETGYFEISLQAYGRSGRPCSRCGNTLETLRVSGRSAVFCPFCQPL
ncbi:bifunctional DNA-formamidopyrimidine glycosylase/DNA-(apurinic or apyrimidinic site) lyase [Actinobaculum sp. 352]|uniref:bifunctional DNA-formamidopyrimidine glycosylase/DNA-(apurinic or apyrimidinic site) lyase n=1 Tax=Actinobaculum sp. 352 TaxID=2490946 RepID=UPI001F49C771|nr:bifunctional DNA-formamidopyrimidine glycosylase/DNA-(apurinic or apyrimidinic site) lyase [Actinobaculum sp. 352]